MSQIFSHLSKVHISKILVIPFIILQYLSGCSENITEPEENEAQMWYGQLVDEVVSAVLKPDSTVWLWGENYFGTLGNGTLIRSDYPVNALNLKNIVSIDLSFGAAFAVDKDGGIWFWGNYWTYFGPQNIDTNVTVPIKIAELKDVICIQVFGIAAFLLTKNGSTYYMRMDPYSPTVNEGPSLLNDVSNVVAINKFSGLTADGRIYMLQERRFLTGVPDKIVSVQTTQVGTLVLKNDGTVWSWVRNDSGQVGNVTFIDSEVVAISSNYDYCMAIKKDGTVWVWDFVGTNDILVNTPVKVEGLNNVKLIYAGVNCLAMKDDGTYWTFPFDERIPRKVQFN